MAPIDNVAHGAGGVMFSVSFLQQFGVCGNAILTFAILQGPTRIGADGNCVVLRKETLASTSSLSTMKFYAVCKGDTSAEIWYSVTANTDVITSMKLIGGVASVGYVKPQNQAFTTTAPSGLVPIDWDTELV